MKLTRREFIAGFNALGTAIMLSSLTGCSDSVTPSQEEPEKSEPSWSEEDRLAYFFLLSDIHVTNRDTSLPRFKSALKDIASLDSKPDAIIVAGDLTDHGLQSEYDLVLGAIENSPFSLSEDFVFACGNHDHRCEEDPTNEVLLQEFHKRFIENCSVTSLFYDTIIADHHFIVLGPDMVASAWDKFAFSEQQLYWLDDLLSVDDGNGMTSIVICHEPIQGTVSGAYKGQWGYKYSLDDPKPLRKILRSHKKVVYISGHSHVYPAVNKIKESGPVYVTTGSTARCRNENGESLDIASRSLGISMGVFEGGYEFQVRDFEANSWLEQYRITT